MNRMQRSKEVVPQTAEPHTARRAIRYRAADNTQQAIARQFPGMFATQMTAQTQQPAQQSYGYAQAQQGVDNATQTA
jgi:hypothetical protein